jgi:FtsP/CotA-like multicopper oxidase with cupredoxin domain
LAEFPRGDRPQRTGCRGDSPPPWERGLEDTWQLDPGEEVVVAAAFTDHTGPFMVHCHMLDHEDHGMMATFEVVP